MNKWFTSFDLAKLLLTKNITIVGADRLFKYVWIPGGLYPSVLCPNKKENIFLISTMDHDAATDNHNGNLNKSEIVTFYNSTKGGVYVVENRNSRRRPMMIFYSLLNIAEINANIIHAGNNNCE
ncbi:hypothetical protein PR048_014623 [Dryococelus australis]|uniref:PiggyBac transposable element-derived protein domain-containing protein n=1 Tax=Dryococelus australis TaxID=614101 RepID=A0ABQ9HER0_9NEOP|nr:hypothetical protein PR048_014623 [Dryococelus australis]